MALIGRLARIFEDKSNEPEIAAFNTKGQVKSKVVYPLAKGPGQSPSVLDGIYIRTEFRSYNFFPGVDSPGSDLLQISGAINQLPALIQETEGRDNASGFNTNGWIKTKLTIPPTEKPSSFTLPTQGTYARVGWSDFVYFPGLDSPLGDIKQLQGKQIWELVDAARKDSSVLAFNTNGWLKNKLVPEPVEVTSSQPFLYGLYIKLVADDETRSLDQAFFLLKATAMIWAKGILVSTQVREGYQKAISAACQEIQDKVDASREAPWDGASTAENARSQYLLAMRRGGTSAGIFAIARGLKLYGGSYLSFLNSSALELYKKKFADLSLTESQLVS